MNKWLREQLLSSRHSVAYQGGSQLEHLNLTQWVCLYGITMEEEKGETWITLGESLSSVGLTGVFRGAR